MSLVKCSKCGKTYNDDPKFFPNGQPIRCPFCKEKSFSLRDIFSTVNPLLLVLVAFALIGLIAIFSALSSPSKSPSTHEHNDGYCDICGRPSAYSDGFEEYCDKHLKAAADWYIGQNE